MKFPTEYAVFDLETTGLDTNTARITEMAIKVVLGGEPISKSWFIKQDGPIPEKITEITGITDEMCEKEGVPLAEALAEFSNLTQGKLPIVGHNIIRYDIPLIICEYQRVFPKFSAMSHKKMVDAICERAFDTAPIVKAEKLGEVQGNETNLEFSKRIMNIWAKGVRFALELSCEERKIDVSDLTAHRAASDVEMTYRLFQNIINNSPTKEN